MTHLRAARLTMSAASGLVVPIRIRSTLSTAFEEPIVRLVSDHAQLGEGLALTAHSHDFRDELRMVPGHICVLLEIAGLTHASKQIGARKFEDER